MQGIIKDCGEIANTIWFKAKVLYFQKLKRYSVFANYLENQVPALVTQYHDWIVLSMLYIWYPLLHVI